MDTKKKVRTLLLLMVFLLAVASWMFVYQKNNQKVLKTDVSQSTGAKSVLSFSPATVNAIVDGNFTLEAKINPNGNQVTAVELHVSFPSDKIQCSGITADSAKWNVLAQGAVDNSGGKASIIVGIAPGSSGVSSSATVASLVCKAKLAGTASISFDSSTQAAATGETGNVLASTTPANIVATATPATPPTCWMKAEPSAVTVPTTGQVNSTITWGSSNATKADAECTGPVPIAKGGWWPNMTGSNYPSGYPLSFSTGTSAGTETCKLYLDGSATASCSVEIKVNTISTSTYSCTGTTPANSSICSGDGEGLTTDVAKKLVSACTTATKCEYTCNSGYAYDSATGVCKASTSASPTCWMKAEPSAVTVPTTGQVNSTITWGSSNATKADAECTGPVPIAKGGWWPNMTGSNYPSGYPLSFSTGTSAGTETCKLYLDGSATANCSVSIAVTASPTLSPTTYVTVVPEYSYTYSYTGKVAPAAGTATNVALILSISAAVTLGVWIAMKKLKG